MNNFQHLLMKFLYKSVSSFTHHWLKFQPIWFSSSGDISISLGASIKITLYMYSGENKAKFRPYLM